MQDYPMQAITLPISLHVRGADTDPNQGYTISDGTGCKILNTKYFHIAKRVHASLKACNGATLNALQQYNNGTLEDSDLHKLAAARIEGLLEETRELRNLLSEMYDIVAEHTFLLDMHPKNPATEVLQHVQDLLNQYTKGSNNGG